MAGRGMSSRRAVLRRVVGLLLLPAVLSASGVSAGAVGQDEMYELWAEADKRFEAGRSFVPAEAEQSRWVRRVGDQIVASWPDRR
ncbi:MAG: hypothetical protein GTN78_20540 [Gemmatimonadales bacterium]|nr:hypothetical protein [Gemmatimonadales bacterium]